MTKQTPNLTRYRLRPTSYRGWRVYRTLAVLSLPRSVHYAWESRESLELPVGKPCCVFEVLPEERVAICEVALQYPKIKLRRPPWIWSMRKLPASAKARYSGFLSDSDLDCAGNDRRPSVAFGLQAALEAAKNAKPRAAYDHCTNSREKPTLLISKRYMFARCHLYAGELVPTSLSERSLWRRK